MEEKISSGIAGLDELLEGGFPAGGTYVILGDSGTGKSILSLEFLCRGAREQGEAGVYVMLEENKNRMLSNVSSFGLDIEALEAEGKLAISPYVRSIVGDVDATFQEGLGSGDERTDRIRQYLTVDSLYREIEHLCKKIDAKRVVVDPISVVTLLSESEVVARMQLLWLIERLRKLEVTTLLTVEEDIGYWRDTLFLSDGIVHLSLKERDGIFERGIMVRKMRGTSHDTSVRPFKISDKGIKIYPSEVVI